MIDKSNIRAECKGSQEGLFRLPYVRQNVLVTLPISGAESRGHPDVNPTMKRS